MKTYILDAAMFENKEASHEYLKKELNFPDYYGNNLDALSDCLTDMDDFRIIITNLENAGEYFMKCYPVLHRDGGAIIL